MDIPQPEHLEINAETDNSKVLGCITRKIWLTQADVLAVTLVRINTVGNLYCNRQKTCR